MSARDHAARRLGQGLKAARSRAARLLGRVPLPRGFLRDRRGIAAVEFALIAPLLFGMYYMTLEVGQAIDTNKKVSRVAALVGDMVAQQSDLTATDLGAIMKIATALVQPYNRSGVSVTVTGVKMTTDAAPKAQVAWSQLYQADPNDPTKEKLGAGRTKGANVTIPDKLRVAGKFLVMVEARLTYKPLIGNWTANDKKTFGMTSAFAQLGMGDNSFQVPRTIDQITCTGC